MPDKPKRTHRKLSEDETLKARQAFKPPPEETDAQFEERVKRYSARKGTAKPKTATAKKPEVKK